MAITLDHKAPFQEKMEEKTKLKSKIKIWDKYIF